MQIINSCSGMINLRSERKAIREHWQKVTWPCCSCLSFLDLLRKRAASVKNLRRVLVFERRRVLMIHSLQRYISFSFFFLLFDDRKHRKESLYTMSANREKGFVFISYRWLNCFVYVFNMSCFQDDNYSVLFIFLKEFLKRNVINPFPSHALFTFLLCSTF